MPYDGVRLDQLRCDDRPEPHRLEVAQQRLGSPRLHVEPGGFAIIDQVQRVLDMPSRAEDQGFGRAVRRQSLQVLRRERVQPAQPVTATDADHRPVREVDDSFAARQEPLLAIRVTVVRRHTSIRSVRGYGARPAQQGAGHCAQSRQRP